MIRRSGSAGVVKRRLLSNQHHAVQFLSEFSRSDVSGWLANAVSMCAGIVVKYTLLQETTGLGVQ